MYIVRLKHEIEEILEDLNIIVLSCLRQESPEMFVKTKRKMQVPTFVGQASGWRGSINDPENKPLSLRDIYSILRRDTTTIFVR